MLLRCGFRNAGRRPAARHEGDPMQQTLTNLKIVDATPKHAPFIAWVMLTAARSHVERGLWDFMTDASEPETLRLLERLTLNGERHWAHHAMFIVAEVDGTPAAALSGYIQSEANESTLAAPLLQAHLDVGRTAEDLAAGFARAGSIMNVAPEHQDDGAWVIEHVATAPEFRRQGLVDRLMREIIERGRARGAKRADIGVLIGNDRAQKAYEKAGMRVIGEKRDAEFERVYGCPGVRSLTMSL
jgi:ribosomal protein S18 acetylase RimI-like enzyme